MWRKKDNAKLSIPNLLACCAIATIIAGLSMAVAEDFDRDGLDDAWEATHGFCTNAVAASNLAGWWQMDEVSASNLWDRSGNAVHGVMENFGAAPLVAGLFSNALSFSSNSVVNFADHSRLNITNGFTISAWFVTSNLTERATLARWTDAPSNAWELAVAPNGVAQLQFEDGNAMLQTVEGTTNTANLHDGQWHHVAGTYAVSNSWAVVYVDGLAEASSTVSNWTPSSVSSFTLGPSSFILPPSSFLLDEVRLYNRALSANEVPQLPPTFDDPDGDGLSNLEEYRQGTDPHNPDTDGDGRLDGVDAHPADYYDGVLPELSIVSGNQQTGSTNSFLPQPLVVRVTAGGVPLNNAPVTLAVKQGGGQLSVSTNGAPPVASLPLRTATNGEVAAWWRLAAAPAFTNRVEVTAVSGAQERKADFDARTAGGGRILKRLVAGGTHSMVLGPDGQVWAWGDNSCGQLNDGAFLDRLAPVRCLGGTDAVGVSGGLLHSLMLKVDGTVGDWGYNAFGQLGNGRTTGAEMAAVAASGMGDMVVIEAGSYHTVMLRSDGTVWTCGRNGQGELGDGTTVARSLPVRVNGLDQVVAISASLGYHAAALRADGTVWCWGYNDAGQLGDGTKVDRNAPVRVNGLENVAAIATGGNSTLALKSDGTVWAWGQNDQGQLGDGTCNGQVQPVQILKLSNIVAIAAGGAHGLALKADGTVWAWGCGGDGRLGDGSGLNRESPVPVPGLSNITAIAAGMGHSLAMTADGNVWAWGENYDGELGDGTRTNRLLPVLAQLDLDQDGLPDSWERQYFLGLGYAAMDDPDGDGFTNLQEFLAGTNPMIADSDGDGIPDGIDPFPRDFLNGALPQLRVVGGNGQSADPGSFLPQPLVVEVTANGATVPNVAVTFSVRQGGSRLSSSTIGMLSSTLVVATDGSGRASALVRLGPVAAFSNRIAATVGVGVNSAEVMFTPSTTNGTRFLRRTAGGGFHSILLADDATMWGWGMNSFGQLGDGTYQERTAPVRASALSDGVSVATGWGHSLFLKADGTVWGCGYNSFGQLGNMWSSAAVNVARPIAGLDDVVAVAAGAFHSVALRSDGSMWVVGRNYEGELGDGTTNPGWTPSPVGGLGPVRSVSAGYYHTVAVLYDGTVWAWGANWYGQLGDGSTTTRTVPVPVSGLDRVTMVLAGEYHTLALKSDGTVWAWGLNDQGQLGDGTGTPRNAPVQVVGLSEVVEIAAGGYHSMARKTDGSVWAWGGNWVGQLGLGHTTTQYVPVQLVAAGSANAIAAGQYHSLVRRSDGAVIAAGYNSNGQIGDGTTVNRNATVETPLDIDLDGLPDSWERRYFFDLGQNGSGDFDGDGLANLLEFQLGTDPTDYYNGNLPILSVVSGDNQNGPPGTLLPQPLVVQVMGAQINGTNTVPLVPLGGAPLTFTVADGEAQLCVSNGAPLSTSLNLRSDTNGQASVMCHLSSAIGITNRIAVTAISGSTSNAVCFTASAADATPPLVAILSPENGQWTTNTTVEVSGIARDDIGLVSVSTWLNGSLATNLMCAAATTNLEFAVSVNGLVTGSNALEVVARDLGGNTNSQSLVVFRANGSSDLDGDGISDMDELYVHGTDPQRADSDGDGLPDGWEIRFGLNPLDPADAAQDKDGDGQTNLQEFQQGTDPTQDPFDATPLRIQVVSGNNQYALTNVFLPRALTIQVSTNGVPLTGIPVRFSVVQGMGNFAADTNQTVAPSLVLASLASGQASAWFRTHETTNVLNHIRATAMIGKHTAETTFAATSLLTTNRFLPRLESVSAGGFLSATNQICALGLGQTGQVFGSMNITNQSQAFRWENGILEAIGTLGGVTRAYHGNRQGQTVGCGYTDGYSTNQVALIWQGNSMTRLPGRGGNYSAANRINDSGQIVGYASSPSGSWNPVLWQNGSITNLSDYTGGASSINNHGTVVGECYFPGNSYRNGFVWKNGIMTNLGTLSGDRESQAYDINEREMVVGYSYSNKYSAVVWVGQQVRKLNALNDGESRAMSINNHGNIVGYSQSGAGGMRACLWTTNSFVVDLNRYAPANSALFVQAISINDQNQILVRKSDDNWFLIDLPEDSDGDGMPDFWEIQYGLSIYDPSDAALDSDGDGLTNLQEYIHGTDPTLADTDGDLTSDNVEIQQGKDPLDRFNGVLPVMTIVQGNRQSGPSLGILPLALTVQLISTNGTTMADAPVRFEVAMGSGRLLSPQGQPCESLDLRVSAVGQAAAKFQLGADTMPNVVRAMIQIGNKSVQREFLLKTEGSPGPQIIDLGTLGGTNSWAKSINNLGQVVGNSLKADGSQQGFLWQNGTLSGLTGLLRANDINDGGLVVGWNGNGQAMTWRNGVAQALDQNSSEASCVNNQGTIAGMLWGMYPCVWTNGVRQDFSYSTCAPVDINEDGGIVGSDGWSAGMVWKNGSSQGLPYQCTAFAVNDHGEIVGAGPRSYGDWPAHALLWGDQGVIDVCGPEERGARALGINNRQQVVGWSYDASWEKQAFFWQNGKRISLSSLLPEGSSWILREPVKINDRGQIVGNGILNGQPRAFLLILDPANVDTDGDGMPDWWETLYGLNPADPSDAAGDPDGDGLTNLQEYQTGSNPRSADTDGDGLNDLEEFIRGTHPAKADTDGDGLTDSREVQLGTNPLLADTDGDGMSDGYEYRHGLNPFVNDALGDLDRDGVINCQDARPNDPSVGRLTVSITRPIQGSTIPR